MNEPKQIEFPLVFPKSDGAFDLITLKTGEMLFVLGANGSGKSSIISHFTKSHPDLATRISAHRQTWFQSNAPEITANSIDHAEHILRSTNMMSDSRYRDQHTNLRNSILLTNLIDFEALFNKGIVQLVKQGDYEKVDEKLKEFSPLKFINELLKFCNMPIKISIEKNRRVMAQRKDGPLFGVDSLSDGERNALLIATEVLTAAPGRLLLLDEPERHLHRSIVSPLLARLLERRKDCAFVIATHDVALPLENRSART